MNQVPLLSQTFRELATFAMRLAAFAATPAIIGAFFLPWTTLDGMSDSSSGAELVALVASPTVNYLFAVSTLQAGVLVGCPALLIVSVTIVMARYARRKTAPFATCVVFASSISVIYGAPDLTARSEFGAYIGISLIVLFSAALLVHQALIKLRGILYRRRTLPTVYQALSVLTQVPEPLLRRRRSSQRGGRTFPDPSTGLLWGVRRHSHFALRSTNRPLYTPGSRTLRSSPCRWDPCPLCHDS